MKSRGNIAWDNFYLLVKNVCKRNDGAKFWKKFICAVQIFIFNYFSFNFALKYALKLSDMSSGGGSRVCCEGAWLFIIWLSVLCVHVCVCVCGSIKIVGFNDVFWINDKNIWRQRQLAREYKNEMLYILKTDILCIIYRPSQ